MTRSKVTFSITIRGSVELEHAEGEGESAMDVWERVKKMHHAPSLAFIESVVHNSRDYEIAILATDTATMDYCLDSTKEDLR